MALHLIATRIDDRLIHGQGSVWLRSLPVNIVVVVDDNVSNSKMEQDLMSALVPSSCDVRFFSVQKTIDVINKASDSQKVFLLFKSLKDIDACIDGGVPIKELNIGNIRKKKDSKKLSPYVHLQNDEMDILRKFIKNGVKLNSKQTPMGEAKGENIDFTNLLAK